MAGEGEPGEETGEDGAGPDSIPAHNPAVSIADSPAVSIADNPAVSITDDRAVSMAVSAQASPEESQEAMAGEAAPLPSPEADPAASVGCLASPVAQVLPPRTIAAPVAPTRGLGAARLLELRWRFGDLPPPTRHRCTSCIPPRLSRAP